MRINSGLNQQANIGQNRDAGQVKLEVGKIIEGKVLAVDGKNIMLQTSEGAVKVFNASNLALSLDSILQFEILDQSEGVYQAKPLLAENATNQESSVLNEQVVKTLLGNEGASILEAMKTLNIPFSQSNYDQLKSMGLELKVLSQMLTQNPEGINGLTPLEGDLKSIIKALDGQVTMTNSETSSSDLATQFKAQVAFTKAYLTHEVSQVLVGAKQLGISDTVIAEAMKSADGLKNLVIQMGTLQAFDKPMANGMDLQKTMNLIQNMDSDLLEEIQMTLPKSQEPSMGSSVKVGGDKIQEMNQESQTTSKVSEEKMVSTVFKNLIDQFNNESKAQFLKNSTPLNLKNIMLNALVTDGVKSIDASIHKINQIIGRLPRETQSEVLALIDKRTIDSIESLVKFIESSGLNEQAKNQLTQELGFVKDVVQMTSQFGDQVMVLQLPIEIEDRSNTVSLYVKKKQKNEGDDDQFTILVALQTHTLGEVRCIVEKQQSHYGLHFKLENEAIKVQFESEKNQIREVIEALDISDLSIDFAVSQDVFPGVLLERRIENGAFDMKV